MEKVVKIDQSTLEPLVPGQRTCVATDCIFDDGCTIGYMYREVPEDANDSGWRFFEGAEMPDYLAVAENFARYDLNTMANFDRSILPFLDSAVGTALTRSPGGFAAATVPEEES